MTSVNVTENKYSVSVTEGVTTVVTVKAPGPQGPGFPDGNLGDVTSSNTGASVVVNSGAITNAKVNDSAAIAGTKISPDFGSQNITTTGNAVFGGNLTVSGTTTTIDTTTLRVEDKNIELGKVGSPTDITADGGGITLLGDTNHTFNWLNATDSWTSSEHIALPDNKKLQLGDSQDLAILHDGTDSKITNITGNLLIEPKLGETGIKIIPDGSVELFHDNVKKAETSAKGFALPVDSKLQLGGLNTGGTNNFFEIYHTSTGGQQSFIQTNGGLGLTLKSHLIKLISAGSENYITCTANGSVELYHNGLKKIETTSSGITVQGSVTTEDMNMSNLNGTANEVDNTKGSWSIQEGADDLFLINRVNGKKYKFNLTEIS